MKPRLLLDIVQSSVEPSQVSIRVRGTANNVLMRYWLTESGFHAGDKAVLILQSELDEVQGLPSTEAVVKTLMRELRQMAHTPGATTEQMLAAADVLETHWRGLVAREGEAALAGHEARR